jgi:hypothetical protein
MSLRTKTQYKILYGSSGSQFPDNTTGLITEPIMRQFGEDQPDSFVMNADLAVTSADTSGGTITLAFASSVIKTFKGSASFAGPKTIAHSGDSLGVRHVFFFEITNVAAVLTLPASYLMSDPRFDGTAWTPNDIGKYKLIADFDGTNWIAEIFGPYV